MLQVGTTDVQPSPVSHAKPGHWIASPQLWLPVHVTSHAHAALQSMPRHDPSPEHATSHGPGPHSMPRHALSPEHVIVHPTADVQSMPSRQVFWLVHRMSHVHPVGHVIELVVCS